MSHQQTLFLAWQDRAQTRRWFPIGRLDALPNSPRYRFRYTRGAQIAWAKAGLAPLPDFPEFTRAYEADELFPLFRNRVMAAGRPDFSEYLENLGLRPEQRDPIEILSITGGGKVTDAFEVFPKLEKDGAGNFQCRFFLHGSRHLSDCAQGRVQSLKPGDPLIIALELNNPATGLAIQVQTVEYCMIGWAPRYLVSDLASAIASSQGKFDAAVVRVNPLPVPSKQRLLVEFRGRLPSDLDPMSKDEFQPLV